MLYIVLLLVALALGVVFAVKIKAWFAKQKASAAAKVATVVADVEKKV